MSALLLSTIGREIASAESPQSIRFGTTLSLTGSAAMFGQACQNGITLAVEDVNATGGIQNKPLEVLSEDFGDLDLKRAVSAAHQFVDVRGAVALLPNWSEDAEVFGPITKSKNIISMTLGAGGPRASRFSTFSFRATGSDGELARKAVKDAVAEGKRDACLVLSDSSYYVDMQKDFVDALKTSGANLKSTQILAYNETNVAAHITNLRKVSCDIIFLWAAPSPLNAALKELRHQHIKGTRVLAWWANTPETLELIKNDENSYYLYFYPLTDKAFLDRYQAHFHIAALRPAGNCYDGIRVLARVMNEVGMDATKVAQRLLSLHDYNGATGPFIIQPDRERTGEYIERLDLKTTEKNG